MSTAGGFQPVWARTGQELFYIAPGGMLMSVPDNARDHMDSRQANQAARGPYFRWGGGNDSRTYDVSADGKRFLMIKQDVSADQPAARIVVVQHWVEELKRLVPTK